ncbi:MAG: hypothetical protein WBE38_09895, partial [Terracidiphilus sp.]
MSGNANQNPGLQAKADSLPDLPDDPNAAYCVRLAQEAERVRDDPSRISPTGRSSRLAEATPAALPADARLQWDTAIETGYSPSKWLLEQELRARRRWDPAAGGFVPQPCYPDPADDKRDVYEVAAEQELTGICFSGGGIRSATFNLG